MNVYENKFTNSIASGDFIIGHSLKMSSTDLDLNEIILEAHVAVHFVITSFQGLLL